METVTQLFNSLVEYFSNFNWEEALNSLKMLVENFDVSILEETYKSLVEFLQSIF